jgi:hypothetical protein
MKRFALGFALPLLVLPVLGNTKSETILTGQSHMEFSCHTNLPLELHVRSGEILIVGTDDPKITIDLAGKNADKIEDVKGRLSVNTHLAQLSLTGGPRDALEIIIHIPKNSDLSARILPGKSTSRTSSATRI